MRRQAERGIAAEVVGEVDEHRLARQAAGVDPGEESRGRRCCRRPVAGERPAAAATRGLAPRPRGSLEPEASSARRGPSAPARRPCGRGPAESKARAARSPSRRRRPPGRSSACAARTDVGGQLDDSRAQASARGPRRATGHAAAALDRPFRRRSAIGDDEHRPVIACGPPHPAVIDCVACSDSFGVVDQQPHGKSGIERATPTTKREEQLERGVRSPRSGS
jgi:hypothetical protein